MNKWLLSVVVACLCVPVWGVADEASPAAPQQYEAGKQYQVLAEPVRTANPDKIEVNEVFWYGCSHCYQFEDMLESWAQRLPADVVFERTPAIWQPVMEVHARAYYVAKQLGVLDKMHRVLFKTMHVEKHPLENEDQLASLFVANGVDEAAFRKAFNSFSVQSLVRQGDARVRAYGIEGTPEIIVNGKYRVTGRDAGGGHQGMLNVVNFLVAKERQAIAQSKKP